MKHITFMVVRIEATEKGEYMTVIGDNDTKLSLPAVHMDSIDIGRHIEVGLHEPSNRVQMVKVGDKTNTDIEAGNKFELSMKEFSVGDTDYVMVVVTCKAVVKAAA